MRVFLPNFAAPIPFRKLGAVERTRGSKALSSPLTVLPEGAPPPAQLVGRDALLERMEGLLARCSSEGGIVNGMCHLCVRARAPLTDLLGPQARQWAPHG